MNKESIFYGAVGLLAGAIITGFGAAYAINGRHQGMMGMMGMHSGATCRGMMDGDDMPMGRTAAPSENKTGEGSGKAFCQR